MPELDNVQIDQADQIDRVGAPSGGRPRPRRKNSSVWVIVVLAALAVGVGGYLYLRSRGPAEAPEAGAPPEVAAAPERASTATEGPAEEIELPPLAASDEVVRQIVQGLSEHPALASWLATEGLVQRFVLAVDNLAVGIVPRKQLRSMAPEGGFSVIEGAGGEVRAAPEAYGRYDTLAAVVASVDAAGAVATYRRLRPLVDEAAQGLGYSPERFDQRLTEAILHLLATPVPAEPPALEAQVLSYHYADPRLEGLSDAQKQLLRMGPDNQRLIQQKLRAVVRELGVPPERIPGERVQR